MIPSANVCNAAKQHAVDCYPQESCGLVIRGEYIPCHNLADNPEKDFSISPSEFEQRGGFSVVEAVIHSHPNAMPAPSLSDMTAQERMPNVPWGIVGVDQHGRTSDFVWFGDCLPVVPLIGRVYVHGVHDCYTLVRDCFRVGKAGLADPAMMNCQPVNDWPYDPITLPLGPRDKDWWLKGGNMYEEGLKSAGFTRIDPTDIRVGDGLLFSLYPPGWHGERHLNHAAVYIGKGLMLHHPWAPQDRNAFRCLSRREPCNSWMQTHPVVVRYTPC